LQTKITLQQIKAFGLALVLPVKGPYPSSTQWFTSFSQSEPSPAFFRMRTIHTFGPQSLHVACIASACLGWRLGWGLVFD